MTGLMTNSFPSLSGNTRTPEAESIAPGGIDSDLLPLDDSPSFTRTEPNGTVPAVEFKKRGVKSHFDGPELWKTGIIHRSVIADKLHLAGGHDFAAPLDECGTRHSVAVCTGCNAARRFSNRCDLRYCPACQPRLARERRQSVEWWTKEVSDAKHVVLTVRNVPTITKEYVQWFKDCFARLRRTKFTTTRTIRTTTLDTKEPLPVPLISHAWSGGFYSLEVTNEGAGWHLHLHALVSCPFIDAGILSHTWDKITKGAGYIVRVKEVASGSYLQELLKYTVKGSEMAGWAPADVLAFVKAFDGLRTFGVFGTLRGARAAWRLFLDSMQAEKPACACGCTEVEILTDKEWEWRQTTEGGPPKPDMQCMRRDELQLGLARWLEASPLRHRDES